MSILIANIGTSDIAVKVGDYFLPIGFDRNEPNLTEPDFSTPEGEVWAKRRELLGEFYERELGLSSRTRFREATAVLLAAYREDMEKWHSRIVVGRLRGVLHTVAQRHGPLTAYLIVTDQPKTETRGYPTDTVHAYDLIEAWLAKEDRGLFTAEAPQLRLLKRSITFAAIDEDRLHGYYYDVFQQFTQEQTIYLSVKGGTAQMQQALKVQALASNTQAQIFVSPRPVVADILLGKPSVCKRVSYWRFQKNQKYQSVYALLSRWDFEGAAVVLSQWQALLTAAEAGNDSEEDAALQQQQAIVSEVITGLQMAVAHMNLDLQSAVKLSMGGSLPVGRSVDEPLPGTNPTLISLLKQYDPLENLYAQCKIYVELKQISHFLSRLGTFYEVAQKELIKALGGLVFYSNDAKDSWPKISADALRRKDAELWQLLKKHFRNKQGKEFDSWKMGNRYSRSDFIKGLIKRRYGEVSAKQAPSLAGWRSLDFWYGIRNILAHRAEGINEDRLEQIYGERDLKKKEEKVACRYVEILPTMRGMLATIKQENKGTASAVDPDYGLYGEIRAWAIALLNSSTNP